MYLRFQVKLSRNDGKEITGEDWLQITPVDNLLHSMFKQVDLEINAVNVIATPQNYA